MNVNGWCGSATSRPSWLSTSHQKPFLGLLQRLWLRLLGEHMSPLFPTYSACVESAAVLSYAKLQCYLLPNSSDKKSNWSWRLVHLEAQAFGISAGHDGSLMACLRPVRHGKCVEAPKPHRMFRPNEWPNQNNCDRHVFALSTLQSIHNSICMSYCKSHKSCIDGA